MTITGRGIEFGFQEAMDAASIVAAAATRVERPAWWVCAWATPIRAAIAAMNSAG